jgi:hypothetical protein
MNKNKLLLLSTLLTAASVTACSTNDSESGNISTGLRSVILGTGIEGFNVSLTPCGGEVPTYTGYADLRVGQTLPGGLASFLGKPFAAGSEHSFADKFFSVSAGCYDVRVVPVGEGAESCSEAFIKDIIVEEGATTERLFISQCVGQDLGALDVIAALNHDPALDKVWFPESKFSCAAPSELCVLASDPDGDPLRLEVTFDDGVDCIASAFEPSEVGYCADLSCSTPGSYVPHVKVFDQAYKEGVLVDIESLLADFGSTELTSHSALDAQIHVDGVVGFWDNDGDGFGDEPAFVCSGEEEGFVTVGGDCNDGDAAINPDAAEVCGNDIDENCDEVVGVCEADPIDVVPNVSERLPGGTQTFSVVSGEAGPYTWTVNGVIGGDSVYGTIDADGNYVAPASVPAPATFNVCAYVTANPGNTDCSEMTISEIPSAGEDVVVFNDVNVLDDTSLANPSNVTMVSNLLNFGGSGSRSSGTKFVIDGGHGPICGAAFCGSSFSTFSAQVATEGLTLITDTSGNLSTIDPEVRVLMLWLPTVSYSVSEINAMKKFASEGGRIIFIGEHSGFYGGGFPTQNDFLTKMGAVMTNVGNLIDCGYNVLPGSSLRAHQITTGMSDVTMACSSELTLGVNDFALYYDSSNTKVLTGVAKIDVTPLAEAPEAPRARTQWQPTHDAIGRPLY